MSCYKKHMDNDRHRNWLVSQPYKNGCKKQKRQRTDENDNSFFPGRRQVTHKSIISCRSTTDNNAPPAQMP